MLDLRSYRTRVYGEINCEMMMNLCGTSFEIISHVCRAHVVGLVDVEPMKNLCRIDVEHALNLSKLRWVCVERMSDLIRLTN